MNSVNQIRATFLDFFSRHGHEKVPSSSLIPQNDPSLIFTNAGMVQFKNTFTGLETRSYKRAVTAQKCLRAGGKHNDLDNVGYTARHHTFFEMLGNFSFGDYFKEEAILLAWTLLVKEFGLDPEKLLVTVYHDDTDAAVLWKKIAGFSDDRIIPIATNDNFWTMGDIGPCGPCSEIFYDHGSHIAGGVPGSIDQDGDRFVEIWNLVFMQYEQCSPSQRLNLPQPSIDTGMGLERMAAVLQSVHDNYDIDLFRTLIQAIEDATSVKATGDRAVSHRVIADHLRSCAFLIADGVLPSNEGRGYVLRRIMRRAMRHAQLLGAKEPLMWRILPVLVNEMGEAYPELIRSEPIIAESLKNEESRFQNILERGIGLLEDSVKDLSSGQMLQGDIAFKLYDTYGFPLDLTQDALRQRGILVDVAGFDLSMEQQKKEARAHWAGSGDIATEAVWFRLSDRTGATEFLGYEHEKAQAVLKGIVFQGQESETLKEGEEGALILDRTVFYAESGGQIGDKGHIIAGNFLFDVQDTKKQANGVFAHYGIVRQGKVQLGQEVELVVHSALRAQIQANHSATHLLHRALRKILGDQVYQKGSLVTESGLRFDFSCSKAPTKAELMQVEECVNAAILKNYEVTTKLMTLDDAIESGAMALFGEKYGDSVRVVEIGRAEETWEEACSNTAWSSELCGGTHVKRLGDIGLIHIVSEGAIAAGIRRIEALTGSLARRYLIEQKEYVSHIAGLLKTTPKDSKERVRQLIEENRKLEKLLKDARRSAALDAVNFDKGPGLSSQDSLKNKGEKRSDPISFMGKIVYNISARELKSLADEAKQRIGSGVVVFVNVDENKKASLVIGVTKDLTATISAVDLVRVGATFLGGKGGGGRADLAQAGGPNGNLADQLLTEIRNRVI